MGRWINEVLEKPQNPTDRNDTLDYGEALTVIPQHSFEDTGLGEPWAWTDYVQIMTSPQFKLSLNEAQSKATYLVLQARERRASRLSASRSSGLPAPARVYSG